MWWEKKPETMAPKKEAAVPAPPVESRNPDLAQVELQTSKWEKPMTDNLQRTGTLTAQDGTVLGRSLVLKGELSCNEDLLIEGQFEGTINVQEHCLTVGAQGKVKADIHARQVIVHGSVDGKISARDKVELRKTGHVVGDLVSAGVAIEDGAYFKGSIEIVREGKQEPSRPQPAAKGISAIA